MSSERLLGVQFARGLAALTIVIYHGNRETSLPQYVGYIPLGKFFDFGHSGVDFFFVLSGFIIFFVHHNDIGICRALPNYFFRRVTRIYPPYWIATFGVACISVLGHHPLVHSDYLLKSLFLVPMPNEPLLGVAWTLQHEVLFYLAFGVLVASRFAGIVLFGAWVLLVVTAPLMHLPWLLSFIASTYHLQFLMGACAAYIVLNQQIKKPVLLAFSAAIAFIVVGLGENAALMQRNGTASQLLFGLAAALCVIGVAAAERTGRITIGRRAAFFGNASYSIYLLHVTVIGLTARLLMDVGIVKSLPGWGVLIIVTAVALFIAGLFYEFVERPLTSMLNRAIRIYILDTSGAAQARSSPMHP